MCQQRMALLKPRGSAAAAARPRADVVLKVKSANGYVQVGTGSCVVHIAAKWVCLLQKSVLSLLVVCIISNELTLTSCGIMLQVTASGHLDEVQELTKLSSDGAAATGA